MAATCTAVHVHLAVCVVHGYQAHQQHKCAPCCTTIQVATALKLSEEDQATIAALKREIEKSWKMVDLSHEKVRSPDIGRKACGQAGRQAGGNLEGYVAGWQLSGKWQGEGSTQWRGI